MKVYQFLTIFFIAFIFTCIDASCQNLWWQREVPTPSANQKINPNYLNKKRELEQLLDEINSLTRKRNEYARQGQSNAVKSADEMLQFMGKKMNTLEHELSSIPMYISNPNTYRTNSSPSNQNYYEINQQSNYGVSSSSSSGTINSHILTLYKIRNCKKDEFKNDYEFQTASLNIFNELKNNINEIVKSETSSNRNTYDIDFKRDKIKYYEIFINNWGKGNTIGTQEAIKEIDRINEDISSTIAYNLRKKTKLILKIDFQGYIPEQQKIKTGLGKWYYRRYFSTCYIENLDGHEVIFNHWKGKVNYVDCQGGVSFTEKLCDEEWSLGYIDEKELNFKITFGMQLDDTGMLVDPEERSWLNKGTKNPYNPH